MKELSNSVLKLPTPVTISYMWNWGSILGLCLVVQIVTGLFLAMHYSSDVNTAFQALDHIMRDVNLGWLIRMIHANGASMFFFSIYAHMSRGWYMSSYLFSSVWLSGVVLLLSLMATAFLGYVLPWGQMSFWGATVITNLFSAIPFIGGEVVTWLWGGYSVDQATLSRFFVFHFVLPFLLGVLVLVHLSLLHLSGSSNPLGLTTQSEKVMFNPMFTAKDFLGYLIFFLLFLSIVYAFPWVLGDPENFNPANSVATPLHIQPEWYFLFAYAILRSIPSKVGGVLGLAGAVMVFFTFPMLYKFKTSVKSHRPLNSFIFFSTLGVLGLLTWLGACPVEGPYLTISQVVSGMYFMFFILDWLVGIAWDSFFKV